MGISKEADPASYTQQAPEALRVEQNSFLRFIDENRDTFERHSSLTYELRDEEQGCRNSPELDLIVSMDVDLALLLYPQLNSITGKQMRKVKDQIRTNTTNFALGTSDENKLIARYFPGFLSTKPHYTSKSQVLSEALEKSLNHFKTSFHEARTPLVSGIRESKAELMRKFEEFLLSNPSNLSAFQDFLSDKKNHGEDMEGIRPFLSSLAESEQSLARDRKEGILRRAAKKWIDESKERPTSAIIDEFAALIKPKSSNIHEWLKFAAQGEDIAIFLKSRPDVSTWTTELREALSSFVSSRYYNTLSSVERDLEQFRRPLISKSILPPIDLGLGKTKRAIVTVAVKKEPDDEEGALETAKKEKYPVGIFTKEIGSAFEVRVLTEEELTRRLQKEADSIDPADRRMIADLEKIFLSLREDPYGLGTERLRDRFIVVGHKELPLRSLNPGKRIGLSHDHPDSHDIRVVYVIYKNNDVPAIGLEGVYRHNDYMSTFKFDK